MGNTPLLLSNIHNLNEQVFDDEAFIKVYEKKPLMNFSTNHPLSLFPTLFTHQGGAQIQPITIHSNFCRDLLYYNFFKIVKSYNCGVFFDQNIIQLLNKLPGYNLRWLNQSKLILTDNFFVSNRLDKLQNITKQSTVISKDLTLEVIKSKFDNLKTKPLLFVTRLFSKYFTFLQFSKASGQSTHQRPLYSHFFSSRALMGKYLITLHRGNKSYPLRKFVTNPVSYLALNHRGLLNTFNFQYNDNLIELRADNHLLASSSRRLHSSLLSSTLGGLTKALSSSKKGSYSYFDLKGSYYRSNFYHPVPRKPLSDSLIHSGLLSTTDKLLNQNDRLSFNALYNSPLLFKFLF